MRTQLPSVEEQFRATTTRSRELYEQALQVMPGGVTRTSIYSEPYPIYAARGEGCRVWDVDGTRRLDLVVNYTALVAGHAHPAVVEAIREQAARGTSFAAPNPPEVALARELVERILGWGGMIPADPEYLRALRAACDRHGSLLIFDEVISFRVARGGAQELYGIRPDLTTLGKVIGGGLPVAAFGGRADVMELLDPRRPGFLPQAGTLNGHPLGMAAGVATLALLTPEVYAELDRRGERTREGLRALFAEHEIPAQVTGVSSLMQIHFTPEPVRSSRDVQRTDARRRKEFVLGLCNHGVLLNSRGMAALSTPVGEAEIDEFLEAVDTVPTEARARA